jgi:hypothetical protein
MPFGEKVCSALLLFGGGLLLYMHLGRIDVEHEGKKRIGQPCYSLACWSLGRNDGTSYGL